MRYTTIEKAVGETPLAALEAWRTRHSEYKDTPLAYAGRLDPMASGKLLILIGDECKQVHTYHALDKQYEIEVLLDIGTDTGDILGIPTLSNQTTRPSIQTLKEILKNETGTHEHQYPAFSSKPVDGKPLFLHVLEGTIDSIHIPTHEETIYTINLKNPHTLSNKELENRVKNLLEKTPRTGDPSKRLGADFRIKPITEAWDVLLAQKRSYVILPLTVTCGSGTYMRSLAGRIGAALGTTACALKIHRAKIGTYTKVGPISFWSTRY